MRGLAREKDCGADMWLDESSRPMAIFIVRVRFRKSC